MMQSFQTIPTPVASSSNSSSTITEDFTWLTASIIILSLKGILLMGFTCFHHFRNTFLHLKIVLGQIVKSLCFYRRSSDDNEDEKLEPLLTGSNEDMCVQGENDPLLQAFCHPSSIADFHVEDLALTLLEVAKVELLHDCSFENASNEQDEMLWDDSIFISNMQCQQVLGDESFVRDICDKAFLMSYEEFKLSDMQFNQEFLPQLDCLILEDQVGEQTLTLEELKGEENEKECGESMTTQYDDLYLDVLLTSSSSRFRESYTLAYDLDCEEELQETENSEENKTAVNYLNMNDYYNFAFLDEDFNNLKGDIIDDLEVTIMDIVQSTLFTVTENATNSEESQLSPPNVETWPNLLLAMFGSNLSPCTNSDVVNGNANNSITNLTTEELLMDLVQCEESSVFTETAEDLALGSLESLEMDLMFTRVSSCNELSTTGQMIDNFSKPSAASQTLDQISPSELPTTGLMLDEISYSELVDVASVDSSSDFSDISLQRFLFEDNDLDERLYSKMSAMQDMNHNTVITRLTEWEFTDSSLMSSGDHLTSSLEEDAKH